MKSSFKFLKLFIKNANKFSVNTYAASSAFFIFLSLVPIIFLVIYAIPFTGIDKSDAARLITLLLPSSIKGLVSGIIEDLYSAPAISLSFPVIIIIWSAAKAFADITQGLDKINGTEDKNYLALRFWACCYTVVLIAAIILMLIIMVLGKNLNRLILKVFPELNSLYTALINLRYIIMLIILAVIFALLYKFAPNKKLKFTEQLPGAVLCSVLWGAFSWGFSFYISHFNSFGLYGRLSTIIIAMFWMYFCMYIFFVGAYLNRFIKEHSLIFHNS